VRFSRHAKNNMRLYDIASGDALALDDMNTVITVYDAEALIAIAHAALAAPDRPVRLDVGAHIAA
jgi:hypothetical protein